MEMWSLEGLRHHEGEVASEKGACYFDTACCIPPSTDAKTYGYRCCIDTIQYAS